MLDNAANNRTFMKKLGDILHERDINFDYNDRYIMCFPHVINIACQHVIAELTNTALIDSPESAPNDLHDLAGQSYEEAVRRDPIALGRNIVNVLRASGQRHDAFEEIIKDGNEKGWFTTGNPPQITKLRPLQLLCDVRTRWDSVFHMIRRLREMRPVSLDLSRNLILPCSTGYRAFSGTPNQ